MRVINTGANTWMDADTGATIADAGGWGTVPLTITTSGGRVVTINDPARADTIRRAYGYLPIAPIPDDPVTLAKQGSETWTPKREGM